MAPFFNNGQEFKRCRLMPVAGTNGEEVVCTSCGLTGRKLREQQAAGALDPECVEAISAGKVAVPPVDGPRNWTDRRGRGLARLGSAPGAVAGGE